MAAPKKKNLNLRHQSGHRTLYAYHPRWGYSFRKAIATRYLSTDPLLPSSLIKTDSEGFRNDHDLAEFNNFKGVKVLVIGCSFAAGHGAENGQRFFDLLASDIKNIAIYNAALSGSAHDQQLLILEDMIAKVKPDVVCLAGHTGCALRNLREARSFFNPLYGGMTDRPKPYFKLQEGALTLCNTPVPRWVRASTQANKNKKQEFLQRIQRRLHAYLGIKNKAHEEIYKRPEYEGYSLTRMILTRMIETAKASKAGVFLMPLPTQSDVEMGTQSAYLKFYQGLAAEHKIDFLNVLPAFDKISKRTAFILNDGHYSPEGHKKIANFCIPFFQALSEKR